jgi:hypothetical protein
MKTFIICVLFAFLSLHSLIASGQEVAVSMTKMNTVYRLLENPIKVVIENQTVKKIVAIAKLGTLKPGGKPGEYFYYTDDCSLTNDLIYVGVKTWKGVKWLDTISCRILLLRNYW